MTSTPESFEKSIQIRPATALDVSTIQMIEHNASQIYKTVGLDHICDHVVSSLTITEWISSCTVWVAIDGMDNKIVGFIGCSMKTSKNKWIHIDELSVMREYQQQGIGKQLIEYVIKICVENRIKWISLTTYVEFRWCMRFYKKLGFNCIEQNNEGCSEEWNERLDEDFCDEWDLLLDILKLEKENGLTPPSRVAMVKDVFRNSTIMEKTH